MSRVAAAELELVQIILILLAMSVMVAVVVCLLIHYRLVALSLLGRLGHVQEVPTEAARRVSGERLMLRRARLALNSL